MLAVLLGWIFMTAACLGTGLPVLVLLTRGMREKGGERKQCPFDLLSVLMSGLVTAAVYAQFFSLFHRVSLMAFGLFLVLSLLGIAVFRDDLKTFARASAEKGKMGNGLRVLGIVCLVLLSAYFTSRGYMHYDSDLYHAQSIRWIEAYGCVPGLGNLHNRLGYNSAFFSLQALFSFAWLGFGSMHSVNGYLFLLAALRCCRGFRIPGRSRESVLGDAASLFLRLGCIYYLVSIADQVVAPASDYAMVLATFYCLIRFADTAGRKREETLPVQCALALLAVFIVSMKLSAACLVVLAVLPGLRLLQEKRFAAFFACIGAGVLIILPYILRNVVLTGYLVYPMPSLDLFRVDWKVPAGAALADAREIKVWGRGYTDLTKYDAPLSYWFGSWFSALSMTDRGFFALAAAGCLPGSILLALLLQRRRGEERQGSAELLCLQVCLSLCCVFWFVQAPLIRYGCAFLYALVFLDLGLAFFLVFSDKKAGTVCIAAILVLFGLWKGRALAMTAIRLLPQPYMVWQEDYGSYRTDSYEIGGIRFYYPLDGDQCGYDAFPSAPTNRSGKMVLRGNSLSDGFAPAEE